jgi:hypothetical protein
MEEPNDSNDSIFQDLSLVNTPRVKVVKNTVIAVILSLGRREAASFPARKK